MLRDRLTDLLEPIIKDLGYELIVLEFGGSSGSGTLRLFIDGPNGITLTDCEKVSREVAAVLDVEDPIHTAYQLEVSSPGMDRPLAKPEHFEQFKGEVARVQMLAPVDGRRRFQGRVVGATAETVTLEIDGNAITLPFNDIEKAKLVPDFDKPFNAISRAGR
jgi:ribosome maturation factor RimP